MSAVSDMIRKQFKEGDDIRDAGLTTPEDIVRFDDILYGADPAWQVMDLYRPKNREGEKLPVIVSIHGGGWVYGDKERYQYYCMSLAQRGFAVANFTYRLAPEYKFPASLEDTNLVMEWLCAHAAEYSLDMGNVFAVGDSAGAHALGMYCNICTNPEYAAKFDFRVPGGFTLRAVALNCGQYRMDTDPDGPGPTNALMEDYLPMKGTKEELALIDVTAYVTENFPPTFLMTATGDFLLPQAPLMAEALRAHSVPHIFRFYGDAKHVLGHVFHCNMKSEAAAACNDDECAYFRAVCEGLMI